MANIFVELEGIEDEGGKDEPIDEMSFTYRDVSIQSSGEEMGVRPEPPRKCECGPKNKGMNPGF